MPLVPSATHPAASWFLIVAGAVFLLGYALPLLFVPLTWARWFRWKVPEETDLTVYFGRCLGGVALAVVLVGLGAVPEPERHPALFELIAWIGGLMTAVHVWGAVRRTQPWTETLEIVLYAALTIAALWAKSSLA